MCFILYSLSHSFTSDFSLFSLNPLLDLDAQRLFHIKPLWIWTHSVFFISNHFGIWSHNVFFISNHFGLRRTTSFSSHSTLGLDAKRLFHIKPLWEKHGLVKNLRTLIKTREYVPLSKTLLSFSEEKKREKKKEKKTQKKFDFCERKLVSLFMKAFYFVA